MIYEIIITFFFGIGLRLIFVNKFSADSAVQNYMVERLKENPFGDYTCNKSVVPGMFAYPSLHYYALTRVPHQIRPQVAKVLNIIIDSIMPCLCAYIFCIVFFGENVDSRGVMGLLLVGMIISCSPVYFPLSARLQGMGGRVLGQVVNIILVAGWYYIEKDQGYGYLLVLIGCYLAVSTSMFLGQVIFALMIFSLCFGHINFSLSCFLSFCLFLATNIGGTRDLLQWKVAHWIWYYNIRDLMLVSESHKESIKKSAITHVEILKKIYSFFRNTRNATYHIIGPKLVIDNFMAIPCLWFYFNLYNRSIESVALSISYTVLFAMIGMYILTCFKPLRIFGQPDRYFEYAIPCQGYILMHGYFYGHIDVQELIAIIAINIFIIGINLTLLFRPKKVMSQYNADDLPLVAKFLDKKKRRVLVIPSKTGFELAGLTDKCLFWLPYIMEPRWWKTEKIGFKYWRRAMDSTYYDQKSDFKPTMEEHNLDTVVIRNAEKEKYNLESFSLIDDINGYSIFQYHKS